jgi:hypothetical protein
MISGLAKAKTTKRTATTKPKSIKDGPEWPTRPLPRAEPGPNAAAITAAIKQIAAERRRRQ